MPTGTTGTYAAGARDVLRLAEAHLVRYVHPGIFVAGLAHVQIAPDQLGDFLALLATAMQADQPNAATDPRSRFQEYDQLVRTVYLCQLREAREARLFEIFCLRMVNSDDPDSMDNYRYPVLGPLPASIQDAYQPAPLLAQAAEPEP